MQIQSMRDVAQLLKAQLILQSDAIVIDRIYFDSRDISIAANAIFVALEGSRDGHYFIQDAYNKGVRNFLLSKQNFLPKDSNGIIVDNTLNALQKWASLHRSKFSIPVIGITGSNGKTIVKEWLNQLLFDEEKILRSPKSYNSQLGIALSLLAINQEHSLALIECGISQPNEMKKVSAMVQPNIGLLTNIGSAHSAFFESREQHIQEKLQLFNSSEVLILSSDDWEVIEHAKDLNISLFTFGKDKESDVQVVHIETASSTTLIQFKYQNKPYQFDIPFTDKGSIQNALLCLAFCLYKGYPIAETLKKFIHLNPVQMRLEILEGIEDSVIINDAFNIDLPSIEIALNQLVKQQKKTKTLIITDVLQSRLDNEVLYQTLATTVNSFRIHEVLLVGKQIKAFAHLFKSSVKAFDTVEEMQNQLPLSFFYNKAILLKGARKFKLEKLLKYIVKKSHQTQLIVDLDSLQENFTYYRSLLKNDTKVMAMVKAFGYGTGAFEVAQTLQNQQVDYLGVAYADEGLYLRKKGIHTPIMVMNANGESFQTIIKYDLEPEVYSLDMLSAFIEFLKGQPDPKPWKIHIKLNTGMNRLGFNPKDLILLNAFLKNNKHVQVVSVFSHLSSADIPTEKDFTNHQVKLFEEMYETLTKGWEIKPMRHILNSSGIVNYPNAQMEMVRLGLGMFGISDNEDYQKHLKNVLRFESIISQINTIKKGESIGYSRSFIADKSMTIAVIPVGYADGLSRFLSNGKGSVYIHGEKRPIVGNVCMDMLMVDITGLDVAVNDRVEIFGTYQTLQNFAKQAQTIPYEILTSISSRVKRVYVQS